MQAVPAPSAPAESSVGPAAPTAAPVAATPTAADTPEAPSAATVTIQAAQAHAAAELPSDVLAYNAQLTNDIAALRGIAEPDRSANRREIRDALRAVERRQRSIRPEVRAAAERAALSAVCGDTPPVLSAWDGELIGSERYLRRTAHDPDSIDVENCTPPILTRRLCWMTTCQVRGRNAFGMMVLNRVRFSVGRNHAILGSESAR